MKTVEAVQMGTDGGVVRDLKQQPNKCIQFFFSNSLAEPMLILVCTSKCTMQRLLEIKNELKKLWKELRNFKIVMKLENTVLKKPVYFHWNLFGLASRKIKANKCACFIKGLTMNVMAPPFVITYNSLFGFNSILCRINFCFLKKLKFERFWKKLINWKKPVLNKSFEMLEVLFRVFDYSFFDFFTENPASVTFLWYKSSARCQTSYC